MAYTPQTQLLLSTASTADGAWVYIGRFRAGASVIATGVATDTIEVRVFNGQTPPAVGANGIVYVAAFTADTIVKIQETYSWICARKTAVATSTLTTVQLSGIESSN